MLARRAQETGQLRPSFVIDDLILMLMAHRGLQGTPRAARATASRRFAAYVIEAFRASSEKRTGLPRAVNTETRPTQLTRRASPARRRTAAPPRRPLVRMAAA